MFVRHIGYDPKTEQYLVIFIAEPTDDELRTLSTNIVAFSPDIDPKSVRIRPSNIGRTLSFRLWPEATPGPAMSRIVYALEPVTRSTAVMLRLEYAWTCDRHFVLLPTFDMAPGLDLRCDEGWVGIRIEEQLKKVGIPFNLPESGDVPDEAMRHIRIVSQRADVFAQGIRLEVRSLAKNCAQCSDR